MVNPGGNPNPNQNQNPNVNLDPLLQASIDLARNIDKTRERLESSVEVTRDLAKELKRSSETIKTSFEFSTEVKHALTDARLMASKLGRDYIDHAAVTERISTNVALQEVLQGRIDDLMGKVNTKNLSEDDLLKEINNKIEHRLKKERSKVTDQEIALRNYLKEREALKGVIGDLTTLEGKVGDGNSKVKEMQLKASALAKIFGSMTGIPFLKDFMDFKKISDAFNISNREGFSALGSEIMRVVKSPLFLFLIGIAAIGAAIKALVKAAIEFDKQLTQISNNLGASKEASIGLLDNFRAISLNNENLVKGLDNAFLSIKNQTAATAELQETLGTNSMLTTRMVQSQILMTKQMKMSKEEAAGIQKLSLISGKSAEDILQNAVSQNKTAVSYKKIISDISKVNSEISVMYKNNPDLIAKAVIEANKLGLSLEQTQQISKSLLDFETSIAGELEAELLTGQRLNFEKARALALDGKSVEAAQELLGQMGGLEGLTKLNVIQRDRLANSIGQSAEQLTTAAREQEVLNKLGFENRKALEEQYELLRSRNDQAGIAALMEEARKKEGGEVLLQDIARANVQERFEESVQKLKEIFTEIAAGPLIKMMEGLANSLSNTDKLKNVFNTISIILGIMAARSAAIALSMTIASGGLTLASAAVFGGALAAGMGAYATNDIMSEDTDSLRSGEATRAAPSARAQAMPPQTLSRPETIPTSRAINQDVAAASNTSNSNSRGSSQDSSLASNDRNSAVIQNNIVLTVDGIGLSLAQKKVQTSFA
jgi:hypothetical protein